MFEKEWLLTCAPIGILESSSHSWTAIASGVFVLDSPFIWYVTTHKQISKADHRLHVLLKHKKLNQILFDISSVHKKEKIEWIFDEQNNIAATLFPSDPDFDLKAVGLEGFLATRDMLPAMKCYSVSYSYVLAEQNTKKVTPGVLEGIISRIDAPSKVYVTTPIFPDNYGCPLFIWRNHVDSKGEITLGNRPLYFAGIMSNTISLNIGNEKLVAMPTIQPDYLGVICASELIQDLIFSYKALSQKKRLQRK